MTASLCTYNQACLSDAGSPGPRVRVCVCVCAGCLPAALTLHPAPHSPWENLERPGMSQTRFPAFPTPEGDPGPEPHSS